MSEEKQDSPKITMAVKEKHPGQVQAGRRLAVISKQTKERRC